MGASAVWPAESQRVAGRRPNRHQSGRAWARRASHALTSCVAVAALPCLAAIDPPPVSAFTDPPRFDHAALSPLGTWFARSGLDGDRGRLKVIAYPGGEVRLDLALRDGGRIRSLQWKSDDMLVFEVRGRPVRFGEGCGAFDWRGDASVVMVFDAKARSHRRLAWGTVVDMLAAHPYAVLVACDTVNRIDTRSGWGRRAASPSDAGHGARYRFPTPLLALDGYVADRRGNVVFNVVTAETLEQMVFRRERGAWQRADAWADSPGWLPIAAGPEAKSWYALATGADGTLVLALHHGADGRSELLAANPVVDVSRVLFAGGRAYAAQFDAGYPTTEYIDTSHPLARQHAELARLFPGRRVTLTSWTADYARSLAVVEGDRMPGDLVLVDAVSGSVERLMGRRPGLEASVLAPMTPVEFRARDGATVHGYVTGEAGRRPGATVVLVHDGPHGARDTWGFHALGQLLASRGYQVLQVNFRGSGGYGEPYARRGFGEWGGVMQDDLTDATRWAVEAGIADPDAICILGAGYGAYAAVMGVVRNPRTYRCAVGIGGVYDLEAAAKVPEYSYRFPGLRQTRDRAGSSGLAARSPVHHAALIDAPVFLAHGTDDGRSPVRQSRRMQRILRRAGKVVEFLPLEGQGHEIRNREMRRGLYERVLRFLRTHAEPKKGEHRRSAEAVSEGR